MKRLLSIAIVLACAFLVFAAPASAANLLVTWTLPAADMDGNVYTPAQLAAAETVVYQGTTSPPTTGGTGQPPGATSRVIVATGSIGTTLYVAAKTNINSLTSALSNVVAYVWTAAPPAPPVVVSVVRQ